MDEHSSSTTARPPLQEPAPVADHEPTQRVSGRFIVFFVLAYFGFWITSLTPAIVAMSVHLTKVLPEQERTGALSLILGVAGLVAIVVNPLVGTLSDRTTSRFGMRKPWMVGGTAVAVIGLFVTATSTAIPLILLGWCVATLGFNTVIAALLPLLPDHVPADQRGRISGLLGMGLPVGAVGGAFLAQAFTDTTVLMFLAPAVVLVVGVGALVLSFTDRRLDPAAARRQPRFGLREFASSFWVSPKRYPDFAWTWLSRFLLFMAVGTVVTFQAFYLINQLDVTVEQVAQVVGLSTLIHYAFSFATSPLGGWLSDRLQRRKVFVAVAALVYAVGLVFIATAESLPMFLVGMAITGIGEGVYLAVDLALVTEVVPSRHELAKIMGVFTTANTLPIAVAPAVAPLLLAIPLFARGTGGNYVALFAAAAIFALVGALVIRPVRAAR